jgi:predicted transcriptional regulator
MRGGLSRDLELLRALADADSGHGVVELAVRIGREKSQVSRALRAPQEVGLVERDAPGRRAAVARAS